MITIICYFFLCIYCFDKNLNQTKINSLENKLNYLNKANSTKLNKLNFTIKEKQKRKLQTYQNIRIGLHMECLDIILLREEEAFGNLIRDSITYAKDTIEKLVKVQRLTNKINLVSLGFSKLKFICQPFKISDDIDADLAIFLDYYVNIEDIRPNSNFDEKDFLAKPEIIYPTDTSNSRPLVGSIIVNVGIAASNDIYKGELLKYIFLHQFTHILGFRNNILRNKGIAENRQVKNRISGYNYYKLFVISPNVLKRAREYFNCDRIIGIELDETVSKEDFENIHWEARILLGDYMTSEVY